MGCHYCNKWAGRALGVKAVCEDCYQVAKVVPEEDRVGVITERLQKIHGLLIRQEQTHYIKQWAEEIAERLEFIGGVGEQKVASSAQLPEVFVPVAVPDVATQKKTANVKKLVVKKFR